VETWNILTLSIFFVTAVAVVIYRLPIRTKVSFRIPTTNTNVEILFGDFFHCDGHWAIPVNEYFDGRLDHYVSLKSVHGQFIQQYCGSNHDRFESQADKALERNDFIEKPRSIGRNKTYPIGTTAVIDVGHRKCFLFASTISDPLTAKAFADVPIMWTALKGMWLVVRNHSNGYPVNLPLVGGGQSGVGLAPIHLLRIMLLSLLVATRQQEVTKTVRIIVHKSLIDRVDLAQLLDDWQ
jgi:hypothetical protein